MEQQPEKPLNRPLEERLRMVDAFAERIALLLAEETGEEGQGLRVRTIQQLSARFVEAGASVKAAIVAGQSPDDAIRACEQMAASAFRLAFVTVLSDETLRLQVFGDEAARAMCSEFLDPPG